MAKTYSHIGKPSGEEGLFVGVSGAEVQVASATGGLYQSGTAVTASAAELNLIDTSVAGTAVASKALVLGANKNVDVLAVADLKLGAAAGTSVTSTAVELNILDGATLTTAQLNAAPVNILSFQIEDLSADADIADRALFVVPTGYALTLTDIKVISQGSPSGIDDSNTCVVVVKNGSNAIVTKTYNTANAFPAAGTAASLGSLSATYKVLAAGEIVKLSVTNGTNADPPEFMVQIEGTLTTV